MQGFRHRRSRYHGVRRVARRRRVFGAIKVAAAGALALIPAACANNDAEVLAGAHDRVDLTTPSTTTGRTTGTTTVTVPARGGTTTTTVAVSNNALPAGAALNVDFTYTAAPFGVPKNPYVAVWVEDANGNLVKTISLWYEQGRGQRWLTDLRAWFAKSGGAVPAVGTGASHPAGSYTVAWDGLDAMGGPAPKGNYTIWVEAAREKGPYEVTSGAFTATGKAVSVTIPDNGELTALSASTAT